MARPIKGGVDYFPLDVYLDEKFELIEAEFGLTGFAVVVKLLQRIYGQQGYYCEWNEEVALLFGKSVSLGGSVVSEIVSAAIRRGIFDKEIYDRHRVLTSAGVQKRYFEAVARRKVVEVEGAYLLVKAGNIPENVSINPVNVNINPENVDDNPTKERRLKKMKGEERKVDDAPARDGDTLSAYFSTNLRHMSAGNYDELREFLADGITDEVARFAVDTATAAGKPTWGFTRYLLNQWLTNDIKTVGDAKAYEQRRASKMQRGKSSTDPNDRPYIPGDDSIGTTMNF